MCFVFSHRIEKRSESQFWMRQFFSPAVPEPFDDAKFDRLLQELYCQYKVKTVCNMVEFKFTCMFWVDWKEYLLRPSSESLRIFILFRLRFIHASLAEENKLSLLGAFFWFSNHLERLLQDDIWKTADAYERGLKVDNQQILLPNNVNPCGEVVEISGSVNDSPHIVQYLSNCVKIKGVMLGGVLLTHALIDALIKLDLLLFEIFDMVGEELELVTSVVTKSTSLRYMKIRATGFDGLAPLQICNDHLQFFQTVAKCKSIESFRFNGIHFDNTTWKELGNAFSRSGLKQLEIGTSFYQNNRLNGPDLAVSLISNIVKTNNTLTRLQYFAYSTTIQWTEKSESLIHSAKWNVNLKQFDMDNHEIRLKNICLRNKLLSNKRKLSYFLIQFCIAFAPLDLPPYVLLEIVDWLPGLPDESLDCLAIEGNDVPVMDKVNHRYKIGLIMAVQQSYDQLTKHV